MSTAADLDALDLGVVNVIRVQNNEFGVKSTILADHTSKHLVYRSGDIPRGTANWLLDLELAYGVFTADRTAMLQQELGLSDPALLPVIEQHQKFFAASSRKQALEKLLSAGDDAARLRAKMCQVLVKASGNKLTDIVRELLVENAAEKQPSSTISLPSALTSSSGMGSRASTSTRARHRRSTTSSCGCSAAPSRISRRPRPTSFAISAATSTLCATTSVRRT